MFDFYLGLDVSLPFQKIFSSKCALEVPKRNPTSISEKHYYLVV